MEMSQSQTAEQSTASRGRGRAHNKQLSSHRDDCKTRKDKKYFKLTKQGPNTKPPQTNKGINNKQIWLFFYKKQVSHPNPPLVSERSKCY